ncbi:MAG: response regulator transcription factor [Bacteroidetes bacterium]|nr:response regulator transcription factor [Bacteroidota bacterium]MBS1944873.1 response regulator transcription factor [Bacteroidota bacterium]
MNLSFLLADDHVIVRRGLRNLLYDRFHASDVAEVATCRDLLDTLAHKEPALLVLDLQLTDGSSMDYLQQICREHPAMRVLVYTMRSEEVYAQRVLALGAAGFLSKESSEEDVVVAVRHVLQGRPYMSETVEDHLQDKAKDEGSKANPFQLLSDREILVVDNLLAGMGVKEISTRLALGPTTVATYKARLFDKLGVTNILDLQRLATAHRHHMA